MQLVNIRDNMAQPVKSDVDANVSIIRNLAMKPSSTEAIAEFYDKWSEHYEQDLIGETYSTPTACAEALDKVVLDKSVRIVDCAAGTGMAGQQLSKRGFTRIDAVDISKKMLEISASRGVYERLICDSFGTHKLKGVEDGYYSGLICSGGLGVGHIPVEAFNEFTRIVKKGGFMVFSISKVSVQDGFRRAVEDMIQQEVWVLIEKADIDSYGGNKANMYTLRRI